MAVTREDENTFEIDTISIPLEDGTEIECAILDEIEYEGQKYIILCAIDEDDTLDEETIIYRYEEDGDDLILDYIEDEAEIEAVDKYYQSLCEEEE